MTRLSELYLIRGPGYFVINNKEEFPPRDGIYLAPTLHWHPRLSLSYQSEWKASQPPLCWAYSMENHGHREPCVLPR